MVQIISLGRGLASRAGEITTQLARIIDNGALSIYGANTFSRIEADRLKGKVVFVVDGHAGRITDPPRQFVIEHLETLRHYEIVTTTETYADVFKEFKNILTIEILNRVNDGGLIQAANRIVGGDIEALFLFEGVKTRKDLSLIVSNNPQFLFEEAVIKGIETFLTLKSASL